MNRKDLVRVMADKLSVTQVEAGRFVAAWEDTLKDALVDESSLVLTGFGTFCAWRQSERVGRNPKNGVNCTIRPRTSVKFKPGKYLLEKMNRK